MSLRTYLGHLEASGDLVRVSIPVARDYEIAGIMKALEPRPVLFEKVRGSSFPVVGNLFCSKVAFARYFNRSIREIIPILSEAIDQRSEPPLVEDAPCQEVVDLEPDLEKYPLLRHCERDGGRYISSGVVIARHPVHGLNLDFHRCMQFSPTELAMRVVRGRHFAAFLDDLGTVDVAVCIGNTPNLLAAAATSVELGINELEIAHAMQPIKLVHAKTVDVWVPTDAEFVLEGTVTRKRRHTEGPFVDLTGTYDQVRQEPVFEVKAITHRADAMWQALLPGGLEHKLLMGMPREPTIFKEVNQVARCLDVNIDPGGCSWLHAVVQIDKQHADDGMKAIRAAFAGHRSCKHVFVVDADINIYDPEDVEWALATRFQGDRDMLVLDPEPGSSLDPSAEPGSKLTTKIGFDLTRPLGMAAKAYEKASYPRVDLEHYLSPDDQTS